MLIYELEQERIEWLDNICADFILQMVIISVSCKLKCVSKSVAT